MCFRGTERGIKSTRQHQATTPKRQEPNRHYLIYGRGSESDNSKVIHLHHRRTPRQVNTISPFETSTKSRNVDQDFSVVANYRETATTRGMITVEFDAPPCWSKNGKVACAKG